MGTRRSYARLTEVELDRALLDTNWAKTRLSQEVLREQSSRGDLYLDVDKGWYEIDIVLSYSGVEVESHIGLNPLYVEAGHIWDDSQLDQLSYAERRGTDPYYLTPDEVLSVEPRISTIPFDVLFDSVDPTRVQELQEWEQVAWPAYRDYAIPHGVKLQRFFSAAAKAGDAMAVWFR